MFSKSSSSKNSPYLSDPQRLSDVIAAIQAMATYKFYKLTHAGWADRLSADESQAEKWKKVFIEHPEFFRLDSTREKASLVWRRQFPKRYNVDTECVITYLEYSALSPEAQLRISRIPLTPADIKALVDTAVNLHSRALEHQKDKRWWAALSGGIGGLLGAIIGGLLK
ncbi:N-carbamoyl-L-amino acid amidohydrolase [Cellvibrio sp. KY-YJ-3]|uniref:N-carbamoyl-L-amino acid amidohydrolase n=1 Tax=Cellvibrio sp. KY-YJ-3 TaxID=454662 RepID=UPI0012455D48|nr:N-carbamoyl-L-amino acid amidohydrolase [Cellvibrio sp. KY-YJ-3]QEY12218.1 N-carbamoyl-L-amino acid amidohydrolase [Cellvibrio sp. KY-YJ-3]